VYEEGREDGREGGGEGGRRGEYLFPEKPERLHVTAHKDLLVAGRDREGIGTWRKGREGGREGRREGGREGGNMAFVMLKGDRRKTCIHHSVSHYGTHATSTVNKIQGQIQIQIQIHIHIRYRSRTRLGKKEGVYGSLQVAIGSVWI
jgi:hypothetical protein